VALAAASASAVTFGAAGCFRTRMILSEFNSGGIDTSGGDPFHDPVDARRELATRVIKDELIDAYFAQGEHPLGIPGTHVADWMEAAAADPDELFQRVLRFACAQGARVDAACPDGSTPEAQERTAHASPAQQSSEAVQTSREDMRRAVTRWAKPPTRKACAPNVDRDAVQHFSDYVRFSASLERAARAVAALYVERLVNHEAIITGATAALTQAAAYLRDRRWHRDLDHHTTGLVVKGGAGTGIYSAGVVWVALNLINRCMNDARCRRTPDRDLRFTLLSGTSTGALIATAVDLYNTSSSFEERAGSATKLARWFTCNAAGDLYCVQDRPIFDLARAQKGVLQFNGIEKMLNHEYQSCDAMRNTSELLLNTVDFRSGRLIALSDQDRTTLVTPRDVVQGALASAVLPVIVEPVGTLPINNHLPDGGVVPATFLDGGIRSELPLMPLVRRGVERLLVVSSSASILGESPPLDRALDIAARYIDVSTGGVTESELGHAQRHVESVRLAENVACHDAAKAFHMCETPWCPDALCEGRWLDVCASERTLSVPVPGDAGNGRTAEDEISELWQMKSFFRDEQAVSAAQGYTFKPEHLRSLFLAGAEAARVRCLELAAILGIDGLRRDTALRSDVVRWCSPPFPSVKELCGETAGKSNAVPSCTNTAPIAPALGAACR
jgi:predicted acylesterase/phospholipase RssA